MNWLRNISKAKYANDSLLLLFFVLASAPQATGIPAHEWISFLYLIPFVLHLLLNWDWLARIPRQLFGKISIENKINVIWNSLLYLMMVFVTISGILISEAALPALGWNLAEDRFWSNMHHLSGNLLMPMLGIHLALHWNWIRGMSRKIFRSRSKQTVEVA